MARRSESARTSRARFTYNVAEACRHSFRKAEVTEPSFTISVLPEEIAMRRRAGESMLWLEPRDPAAPPDSVVSELLRAGPGLLSDRAAAVARGEVAPRRIEDLEEIDAEAAVSVLIRVLGHGLAYAGDEIMPAEDAVDLATRTVGMLSPSARWWTNGSWGREADAEWSDLTLATFDTGVVGVDRDHGLIAWFTDED
jgi:hypothetical protein